LSDFCRHNIPKRGKIYQIATKLPHGHKMYQAAVIYSKWPKNKPNFSIPRPSKIYPNWDFWFENIPSGNPVLHKYFLPPTLIFSFTACLTGDIVSHLEYFLLRIFDPKNQFYETVSARNEGQNCAVSNTSLLRLV
jgi:hypothetical protein